MVLSVTQLSRRSNRIMRYPEHRFFVRHKPWVLTPTCIAPVLPGETLKNALMQSRAVTDPLKNGLIGWFLEHWLFYVKLTDITAMRDDVREMMLDMNKDMSAHYTAAKPATYHNGEGIDWVWQCMQTIIDPVNAYFRDENEDAAGSYMLDGMPLVKIDVKDWTESLGEAAELAPDVELTVGVDDQISATEVDAMMRQWQFLRDHNLTDKTYEDYLRDFGVRVSPAEKPHRPELLRYERQWQYPSNTVDPITGNPSAAASWAVQMRADKDRLFKEPGFIIGLTAARPKVYRLNQTGSASVLLQDTLSWLPAVLRDDPATSMKLVAGQAGPMNGGAGGANYVVDVRDLFLYGDQMLSHISAMPTLATGWNGVALPAVASPFQAHYPAQADVEAQFAVAANCNVRQDGIYKFTIAGQTGQDAS